MWQPAFLSALRESGVVRSACEAARIGRTTAYELRQRDPGFAAAWDEAMEDAADLLEAEAIRRARHGVREPVIYQGRPCGVWVNDAGEVVADGTPGAKLVPLAVTKYSDTLLVFLLKGARPDKYREAKADDGGDAFGQAVREMIVETLRADRRPSGPAPVQPGGAGADGPAAPVADPAPPGPHQPPAV